MKSKVRLPKGKEWLSLFLYLFIFLLGFDFLGSSNNLIFLAFGLLLLVVFVFFHNQKEKKEEIKEALILIVPFLIFAIFISFSNFWFNLYDGSIVTGLASFVYMISIFFLGYVSSKHQEIKGRYLLFAFMSGIFLLTLVSYLATISSYGFFHPWIHRGEVYYYDGIAYSLADETLMLYGFQLETMSLEYALLPPFLLASSLFALFFVSLKKDKSLFLFLLINGAFGFWVLLNYLEKYSLLLFLVLGVICLLVRLFYHPKEKIKRYEKISYWTVVGVLFCFLTMFFVIALLGNDIYLNNSVIRLIFDNGRLMNPISSTINAVAGFNGNRGILSSLLGFLFGLNPYIDSYNGGLQFSYSYFGFPNNDIVSWNNLNLRSFEFMAFQEGGIFAFLSFVSLIFVAVYLLRKKIVTSYDRNFYSVLTIILFTYLCYQTLSADNFPLIRSSLSYISAFHLNSFFLGIVFFLSYGARRKDLDAMTEATK